jgi:uncharacterized protein (UPF0332 family)
MNDYKLELARNFLEKSSKSLDDAHFCLNNERFNLAQNRIYYSIFYIVMALGYTDDFITSKHKQLLGWFNKTYIHERKIFQKELFKIYENAYNNRMESDYSPSVKITKDDVEKNLSDAVYLIEEVKKYLKDIGII